MNQKCKELQSEIAREEA